MQFIASRDLTDDSGNLVVVTLGLPYQANSGGWACPYNVSGLSSGENSQAYGVDALQALLMAIEAIYIVLEGSSQILTWQGCDHGDTGIPRLPPMAWGLPLRHHIEGIMKAEEEFWQSWLTTHLRRGAKPPGAK